MDDGCGMSLDQQKSIFAVSAQSDSCSSRAGLGLAVASRVASSLGGSVLLVQSQSGKGSHFKVKLPHNAYASSYPRDKPLRDILRYLPQSFYVTDDLPTQQSRVAKAFVDFLVEHGFVRTRSQKSCFVVTTDDAWAADNHSASSNNIVILLALATALVGAVHETTETRVAVQSPFRASVFKDALLRADMIHRMMHETRNTTHCPLGNLQLPPAHSLVHVANGRRDSGSGGSPILSACKTLVTADKLSVLLVDDNIINLRFLQMYCKKRQFAHHSANDGQAAVDIFARQQQRTPDLAATAAAPVQLVLMDLEMPVCNGIEATRRIRQLEAKDNFGRRSIILMVSGQDSPSDRQAALRAGADGYLIKPAGVSILDRQIESYFHSFAGHKIER